MACGLEVVFCRDNGANTGDPGGTLLEFLRSRTQYTNAKLHGCAAIGVGCSTASSLPPTSSSPLRQIWRRRWMPSMS
uniref:Uncharacterized protein n=1 Tax=Oryza glumipatula TaxID=40148 RepID=A0A0D9YCN6_9ORYZ